MSKIEDIIEQIKEYAGIAPKEPEKKKCNVWAIVITIVSVACVIAAAVVLLLNYFGPKYFEDFEDDYEDDFDDDFFEDEEEDGELVVEKKEEEAEEAADAE